MKIKKSTALPLLLLIYLVVMAYIGLPHLYAGRYLFYFGVIAATLVIILLLHITLKHREKKKAEQSDNTHNVANDDSSNQRDKD